MFIIAYYRDFTKAAEIFESKCRKMTIIIHDSNSYRIRYLVYRSWILITKNKYMHGI